MFVLLVLALLVGLLVARLRGGTLDALGRVHVRLPWLAAGIVLSLALAAWLPTVGWAAAALLAAVLSASNRRIPGLFLLFLGLALNAAVIGANHGKMPVSTAAVRDAGLDQSVTSDSRHTPAGQGTKLRPLGDVVPFPFWGSPTVLSPGDVLIASGVGLFAALTPVRASRTLRARRAQRDRRRQRRRDAFTADVDDLGGSADAPSPSGGGLPRRQPVGALPAAGVTKAAQRGTMAGGADDKPGRRSRHGEEEA